MAETLYEHAGGDEGLHRLEELFYTKALADPVLRALFTERVPTHVDHLTWFTAESFGGADVFVAEYVESEFLARISGGADGSRPGRRGGGTGIGRVR